MAEVNERGIRDTLAAFGQLPKEASKALRAGSKDLSQTLAGTARQRGTSQGAQAAMVAQTVRAVSDRVPGIAMGGSKRVGRNKVPVYKVMYGAEFGANTLPQFRPHKGRQGYFFYPTVRGESDEYLKMWNEVADDIGRAWVGRGADLSVSTIRSVVNV